MNLASKEKCFGCTACVAACSVGAIYMKQDEHGFSFPVVEEKKCVQCGKCQNICPVNNKKAQHTEKQSVYAVKSKNNIDLMSSSSGGLFTLISDHILNQKGVVYGAAHNDNLETVFTRAVTKEERDAQRGSKYVQSDLGNTFINIREDLLEGNTVLFVGTPCQVHALNCYIPENIKKQLLTIDIICNGVPSPLLFQEYVRYCEKKAGKKIVEHYHRPKDNGWGHVEKNVFIDGTIDNTSEYSQAWKNLFYSSKAHRQCCYSCPYTDIHRVSDITIGDYWGVEQTKLTIPVENGVSLFIANTKKGKCIIERIENCYIEESVIENAMVKQPRLRGVCASADGSKRFWDEFEKNGAEYVIEKYGRCSDWVLFKHRVKKVLTDMGIIKNEVMFRKK